MESPRYMKKRVPLLLRKRHPCIQQFFGLRCQFYYITLIPYYAQVIADFDTADTVRQRRFESLQKLHGQLHLYKERGYALFVVQKVFRWKYTTSISSKT